MFHLNVHRRPLFTGLMGLLFACLLQVFAYSQENSTITIPQHFQATKFVFIDDKIIVHASLNDTLQGNFLLDTGGHTLIIRPFASRLGLNLPSGQNSASDTTRSFHAQIVIEGLELKDVPVQIEQFPYAETWNRDHPSEKIIGVLGMDALNNWAVGIDFPSHTVGWWKGGKITAQDVKFFSSILRYPENIKGAILLLSPGQSVAMSGKTIMNKKLFSLTALQIPMRSRPELNQFFVPAQIDGKETELLLDTGANIASIPEMITTGLHPLFRKHISGDGADYNLQADAAIFDTLSLGTLIFDLPLVGIVPHSPKSDEKDTPADTALLGVNLFTDSRIVMDFPGRVLYVYPYADYNETIVQRLKQLGIGVHRMENSRDFLSVFPQSPGANVGIKSDDELLTINGRSLTATLDNPGILSNQTPFVLRVRRNGTKKPLEFTVPMPPLADLQRVR